MVFDVDFIVVMVMFIDGGGIIDFGDFGVFGEGGVVSVKLYGVVFVVIGFVGYFGVVLYLFF